MRRKKEEGQILVLVALALIVLIGVMGLAIDMGYLRYMKRQIQTAADAGAIAGALELGSCGSGCSGPITTAAQTASSENGFANGVKGVTIGVNAPPIAGDPYAGAAGVVEVIVSQVEPVHFASIFGVGSVTVNARADAKVSSGTNCVYALNTLAALIATINSNCGVVIEQTLDCLGVITAPKIGVVGGSACPSTSNIGLPTPSDPLSYLPAPAVGACGGPTGPNTYSGSNGPVAVAGPVTFNPGVYCGGIQVALGGTANFSPGTYILNSTGGPGGLSVLGGTVNGTDVTFYNTGTGGINITLSVLSLLGSVNLSAPTSGPYEGVLFFQDPSDTQAAGFNISVAGSNLTGAYYFPSAPIQFLGTVDFGQNAPYTILDAQNITFLGTLGFTIKNDYSSLPDGSPIKGGAVLVE